MVNKDPINAYELCKSLCSSEELDATILIDLAKGEETDWLELKAACCPEGDPEKGRNEWDYRWHVAQAIYALANTYGGCLLLGVDDHGKAVGLEPSDPTGIIQNKGPEAFARHFYSTVIKPTSGWKCLQAGKISVKGDVSHDQFEVHKARLDGTPILAVLVRPVRTGENCLSFKEKPQHGKSRSFMPVRRIGEIGQVEELTDFGEIDDWQRNRNPAQERFAGLLKHYELRYQPSIESDSSEFAVSHVGHDNRYSIIPLLAGSFAIISIAVLLAVGLPALLRVISVNDSHEISSISEHQETIPASERDNNVASTLDPTVQSPTPEKAAEMAFPDGTAPAVTVALEKTPQTVAAAVPVSESRIEVLSETGDLIIHVSAIHAAAEVENRPSDEHIARTKVRDEVDRLVGERLTRELAPEELPELRDVVVLWGANKLEVVTERLEIVGDILVASLEGRISLEEFTAYLKAKRESLFSSVERETPFEVTFGFYRENGVRIEDGAVLRSGERFRIEFVSNKDCYVYVINKEQTGNTQALYPRPDIDADSFVVAGAVVYLPSKDFDYVLDKDPGVETVTLIASLAPLDDIEYFVSANESRLSTPGDRALFEHSLQARDTGATSVIQSVDALHQNGQLAGEGALVRTIRFEHR